MTSRQKESVESGLEIAIIGMAGRFPDAPDLEAFWENVQKGVESISFFTPDELRKNGISEEQLNHPDYVRAYGVLKNKAQFDAAFFGYSPKEAEAMDPQVRLFHQYAWAALEDAGYDAASYRGLTGVYAGISDGFSWRALRALRSMAAGNGGGIETHMLDTSLLLSTRVSHKLNLRGPSITLFTACSTSLVAVHLAGRALLTGECDIALAGAVSVQPVFKTGYLYQEGMIMSPDGHCRAFDEQAAGTVFGEGIGIVVLKRLQEALGDGDSVAAVIKGSAVNNDGLGKASFTAPGKNQIVDVIKTALKVSRLDPGEIGYIETHGTATPLGDTIELDALKAAFVTGKKGFCGLGSVKANIGHLDVAAGMAGLIKTVLALRHRSLPPNIHFEIPNPKIDLIDSPFYVNALPAQWEDHHSPLRAGVLSMGVGGTNAFVLLEEAPSAVPDVCSEERPCLIVLSARTSSALEQMSVNLVRHLERNPGLLLDDVAYTLQVGRKAFQYRRTAVCRRLPEAIKSLSSPDTGSPVSAGRGGAVPADGNGSPAARLIEDFHQENAAGPDILEKIGELWVSGVPVDWAALHAGEKRRRIPLPTYPFAPTRYWPDDLPRTLESFVGTSAGREAAAAAGVTETAGKKGEGSSPTVYPRPPLSSEYEPAADEVERSLAEIWQRFFGIDRVGMRDDFFELGGDSLKVIAVVSDIHKQMNVRIPISQIFDTPTIGELARTIGKFGQDEFSAVPGTEERDYYPLSSVQKRLYVLHQLDLHSTSYNNPLLFSLMGDVDSVRIEETFRRLITRHESLRTSFISVGGETVQRIRRTCDFEIFLYDIGGEEKQAAAEQETESEEKTEYEALPALVADIVTDFVHPFDLSQAPLLRVGLIRQEPGKGILIVDMHHIVTDGTSIGIMVREFAGLYAGETLPPLPVQYKDYTQWQRSEKQLTAVQEQEHFWLQQFSLDIPVLNLPTDYPRPPLQSFEGDRRSFFIGRPETGQLKTLALNEEATLFMVLLSIYIVMLAGISGQEDIVVGSPIAARRHGDLRGVIGMLVNTLALRNFPAAELTLAEFLRQVRERTLSAFENQDYLFEDLVERVDVNRDVSRNPVFDTMFGLQNFDSQHEVEPVLEIPGLRLKTIDFESKRSIFDLSLFAVELEDGLSLSFEYCIRLFKAATIERFIGFFRRITAALAETPGLKLAEIDMISPEERRKILLEFNDRAEMEPCRRTVCHLYADQAEKSPDSTALVFHRSQLTYRELDRRSTGLAAYLRENGVGPNGLTALMLERSFHMIIGILGILRTGSAYLPIDPDYPRERIGYMLADSGTGLILTSRSLWDGIGNSLKRSPRRIFIHDLVLHCCRPGRVELPSAAVNSLVYMIYTSGSTGKPKGILLQHGNVVNLIRFQYHHTPIDFSRVLQFATICFDVSFQEIFSTLLRGGTLYLVSEAVRKNVPELLRVIGEFRIRTLFLPASFLKFIFNEPDYVALLAGTIRHIVGAGEQLIVTDIFRDYLRKAGVDLHNHYGPAETHVVTSLTIAPGGEIPHLPAIGRPLSNTQIFIVDQRFRLRPLGVAGELAIGGLQVGRGYLNRPELTAEKFISAAAGLRGGELPFPGTGIIYRTGDLARWQPDGHIEFLGRIDTQLKIRGFRVEPGEIENQLLNHPDVREAVVLTGTDGGGEKYLAAYLVLSAAAAETGGDPAAVSGLRRYLARRLPDYMVPAYFTVLDEIPMTPSRKPDRRALPLPRPESIENYIPPASRLERDLAELWSEILGLRRDTIGREANFFELGGHSLKATILMTRIHRRFEVKVPLGEIFKAPTIAALAGLLDSAFQEKYSDIDPVERQEYYRLSSSQKRIYILQQMDWQSTVYNMPDAVPLETRMDGDRLEQVFRQLIRRHETLRTFFVTLNGEPVQRVGEAVDFNIEYYDLRAETREPGDPVLPAADIKREFVRPFDLSEPPLLRVGLIVTPEGKDILLTDVHHIVCDGISIQLLIREFKLLYEGEALPPLRIQYRDYARWLLNRSILKGMKTREEYWLAEFADDIPVLDLPIDFRRPLIQNFAGSTLCFEIGPEETARLKQAALAHDVTLFMLLLAVFNILMSRLSGQEDIVVGVPVAGRWHDDASQLVGMFVNTLALRNFPAADRLFGDYLLDVKEKTLKAFENQEYPFEDLVERVAVRRDASRNPLFDVMFGLLSEGERAALPIGETGYTVSSAGPDNGQVSGVAGVSKFDMTWNGLERGGRLFFYIEYSSKLFRSDTIQRFRDYFRRMIEILPETSPVRLADIPVMGEAERRKVLDVFSSAGAESLPDMAVHQLFEARAGKNPHRTALVSGTGLLTYGELNRLADRMAARLRAEGIGLEVVAALMLERSPEMVIYIFGILKAGGAYLPIDPRSPRERIRYMMADSGARLLIKGKISGMTGSETSGWGSPPEGNATAGDRLAYIIYTSGSTGRPKGVMIRHPSVVNLLTLLAERYPVADGDTYLFKTPYIFDVSVTELFGWFQAGGRLAILVGGGEGDPREIAAALVRYDVSHVNFVPSLFDVFVETLSPGGGNIFPGLKYLFLAGEEVRPRPVQVWRDRFPRVSVENLYGPTEATVYASGYSLRDWSAEERIPIGRPLANQRIFILDRFDHLLAPGVAGELCIAGKGLGRGYLNRPELTAEKFCRCRKEQDSIGPGSQILYRSGDLARWRPDGHIEFLGRIDQQIKIRGFRIELGEIENRLRSHPALREAAVLVRQHDVEDRHLVAYLVLSAQGGIDFGRTTDTAWLREYLGRSLPDYMIPAHFVRLDRLPVTPAGKIDRSRLPEPEHDSQADSRLPRNEIETKLAALWADILSLQKDVLGIHDNFFQLGGHSLKATILMARIHNLFKVKVTLGEIFKRPTILELSGYIRQASALQYESIESDEEKEYYPLSRAQKRLYILQQMAPDSTVYNLPQGLPLAGEADIGGLTRVFEQLIARHQSLRTSFITLHDEPVQQVHRQIAFYIEFYGSSSSPSNDLPPPAASTLNIVNRFIRPFDLTKAPLLRVGFCSVEEGRYVLLVDMHHIVGDGISLSILAEEFRALWGGSSPGELPPLRIQYRDFARWEQSRGIRDRIKRQESYWLAQFPGEIPLLNLVTDFVRPPLQSFEGGTFAFQIGSAAMIGLKKLAADQGATLFMVLLAIFNVFLAKICSQDDVIVGVPVAGRPHTELELIVGMFVNTLAIRNFPAAGKTFAEFLTAVRERTLRAFDNQEYPFEELVERVAVRRDAARNPLFDVMLVWQNMAGKRGRPWSEETDRQAMPSGYEGLVSRFDMTWAGEERNGRIFFEVEFGRRLFKRETIGKFIDGFKQVAVSVLEVPGKKIAEISLMGEGEKKRVMQQFNDTAVQFPGIQTVQALFEEAVLKFPHRLAVVGPASGAADEIQLTYLDLDMRAGGLARRLNERDVRTGTIAALKMERSLLMVVAVLGILKSGGAYLPIDPDAPAERVRYILADSGARILLNGEVSGGNGPDINEASSLSRGRRSPADSLAYVIYTSGSTGRPKGVMIRHPSVINLLFSLLKRYSPDSGDTYLLKTPYIFDVSVAELFGWFGGGGRLALLKEGGQRDPRDITAAVNRFGVTHLNFVPSLFALFADSLNRENRLCLSSLKYVFLAGEELWLQPVQTFRSFFPEVALENLYGPTEAAVYASAQPLNECPAAERLPIGKPLANMMIVIMDQYRNLQPVGVPGELCIGGRGVACGYLNNPQLTAEKFIRHPSREFSILYRSGDLARWRGDGTIEFLGRMDQQVKIRGFRIEPGEIEHHLLGFPSVRKAAVQVQPDETGDRYLIAYVVLSTVETDINSSASLNSRLKEYLARRLPHFMIPAYFIALKKLPLTPGGKLDRQALPDPDFRDTSAYSAPADRVEEKLAAIWAEILGMDRDSLGIDANFFDLGGHSLKATVMLARIQRELGVWVPLGEVFKTPTIRGLADFIRPLPAMRETGIEVAEKREYYALSSAQKRLFILQQFGKAGTVYNIPQIVELAEAIDKGRLEEIFGHLIKRHESLRTSFTVAGGQPVQRVHREVEFKVEYYPEGSPSAIAEDFIRPFDLTIPPLLRVGLATTHRGSQWLLVDMHHIVSDGVSLTILIEEFRVFSRGEGASSLPALQIQYKDYARWQAGAEMRGKIKAQEAYWLAEFADKVPVLNLFTDYPRPAVKSFAGNSLSFEIEAGETSVLKTLAREQGATLFMVLLAIFNILLSRLSGQEDIVVGVPVAGRRHPALQKIVGMFVNTLALRHYPEGERTFLDLLMEVKSRTLKAFENQEYPLEDLVNRVAMRRDAGRNPIFDVMFNMQNMRGDSIINPAEAASPSVKDFEYKLPVSRLDMSWSVEARSDGLRVGIEYCSRLFEEATIARFMDYFKRAMGVVTATPGIRIADIKVMPRWELAKIRYEFNDTAIDFPGTTAVHQLVEDQVERTPYQVALIGPSLTYLAMAEEVDGRPLSAETHFTYRHLDERAHGLARLLRREGARPGTIVAFRLDRSVEMVGAVLGILKSGGVYLPVDPLCPPERMRWLLADSSARILVTAAQGENEETMPSRNETVSSTLEIIDVSVWPSSVPGRDLEPVPATGPAYVIYTSGSTGRPKGVVVTHRNMAAYLTAFEKEFRLGPGDTVIQQASPAFDACVEELFPVLLKGGRLAVAERRVMNDMDGLARFIVKYRVTVMTCTPLLLNELNRLKRDLKIRLFIGGGDILRPEYVNRLLGESEVYNTYGPTEATVCAVYYRCPEELPAVIPIGRPIANYRIHVLGRNREPLPSGVPGECFIAGDGVSRGYLNRPELTAEKFVHLPQESRIVYRSGDRVRFLPDGRLEFLGRIDQQVKIRGYRIELGEIEGELLRHEAVREAVVIARSDENEEMYLTAYIVKSAGKSSSIPELKDYLDRRLPHYMIPSYFVELRQVPLTANGKVDRRALPAPDLIREDTGAAPRGEIEAALQGVWAEVLGIDREHIGREANFFDLGGHSLKAVRAVSLLAGDFEISVDHFFRYQTIAALAANIRADAGRIKRVIGRPGEKVKEVSPEAPEARWRDQLADYRRRADREKEVDVAGTRDYRHIMLTGAAGYLGAHLLYELLHSKEAVVYLPVRAASREEAESRLRDHLSFYFGPDFYTAHRQRLVVMAGDLSTANLGMDRAAYRQLASTIEAVVHAAARVKHVDFATDFQRHNVTATCRLLEFAADSRKKDFHFISTLSVCGGSIEGKPFHLFSEYRQDDGQQLAGAYLRTKFEAEKQVVSFRQRGLNTSIFRVGNIVFHSRTGRFQVNIADNAFYSLLAAIIKFGMLPAGLTYKADFTFVDCLARAVLLLFDRRALQNEIFHLYNHNELSADELMSLLRQCGRKVEAVTREKFYAFLDAHLDNPDIKPEMERFLLHSGLLNVIDNEKDGAAHRETTVSKICSGRTDMFLEKLGFQWPEVSREHIRKMLDYCRQVKFL